MQSTPNSPEPWPAPLADAPVSGTVHVPGSKSATNRALILAFLSEGPCSIRKPLIARDTRLMASALRSLGARIDETGDGWRVTPGRREGDAHIDCGLAGTVMRFVPPVSALVVGAVSFDGDPRARQRPMTGVIDGLRSLGVAITIGPNPGLPFTVHGTGAVRGGDVTLDASASSQFVSGILLASANFENPTTIRHAGPPLPSLPHVEMTVEMLRDAGIDVQAETADPRSAWWRVEPGPLAARDLTIEPDLSNAGPFVAAAAATGGTVTVADWPAHTTQAGDRLRPLLEQMGAHVVMTGDGLSVTGPSDGLVGVDADLRDVGELTPTITALCALARTPSRLRGIGHLRGHETDRIAALATEINRLGGDVREEADGLSIHPRPLHGGTFETYDDHRMATAAAVVGLVTPGVGIVDVATTSKTLPDFPGMWTSLVRGQR